MKKNFFPMQTHFVGVLLPDDLTLTLEDCRHYMNRTYGCRSGHGTPIHVTLVPPFRLPEEYSTDDLQGISGFLPMLIILMPSVTGQFLQKFPPMKNGRHSGMKL